MKSREKIIEEKARLFKEMTELKDMDEVKLLRARIRTLNWVLNLGD